MKGFPEYAREDAFLTGLDPHLPALVARLATAGAELETRFADPGEGLTALVRLFGREGLLRYVATSAGGAVEVSSRSLCYVRERLAYASPLVELAFAMQGLGSYPISLALAQGGASAFSASVLDRVACGEFVAAFALTEPEAGSDVGALCASARRVEGGYRLSGTKHFISNAGVADFFVVFAKNSDARVTAFLVMASDEGVTTTPQRVLGGHPIGRVELCDVFVPDDRLLGTDGGGMRLALGTLHRFRVTVGAAALGFAQRALDEAVAHVRRRQQFGAPLSELAVVQSKLAEMACDVESARLLVYRAAHAADAGEPREKVAHQGSMAKLMATEGAQRVIDNAVQLFGGAGVLEDNIVARLYTEVRALRIYEGASDIQKILIARNLIASAGPV